MSNLRPISGEQLKADMAALFGNPRSEPSTLNDLISAMGAEVCVAFGILAARMPKANWTSKHSASTNPAPLMHGAQELVEAHIERLQRLGHAACRIDQAQRSVA